MQTYQVLIKTLCQNPNFVSENGTLKKWLVLNKAQNFDEELIELLIENEELRNKFFISVKNSLIFKQDLFVQFLEQKNYLNDSYTQYKNKIGLTIDDRTLQQRNQVALIWPFKDCILEGGQSRDEEKRAEIFFNEILAQDEITQLLEPKVLTNAKYVDKDGEKDFTKFHRNQAGIITDNLIIKGNNLLALHTLKKEFAGKVKLIYIDPPYNTGGEANIFTYNNTFNHSTWLTFMQNRLSAAKDFLRNDGFIAIAIDHYELGYLIVLADEVFGRENRLGIIAVVNNPMGRNQAKYFSTINDFMLVYAKDAKFAKFNNVILDEDFLKTFDKEDVFGKYKLQNFVRIGGGDANLRINKPSFWYPIYVSPDLNTITLVKQENYLEVYPVTSGGQERTWKLSKKSTEKILHELIAVKTNNKKISIMEKYRVDKGQKVSTIWSDKKYNANHHGVRLLEKIIGSKNFSFPKSLFTIIDTIKLLSGTNDLILDFHAGSGTTGHAVLALNKQDGGKRQFIMIEQLTEHIAICNKRISKVLEQNVSDEAFIYFELKKYNQAFIEKIEEAENTQALLQLWKQIKDKAFFKYSIDLKAFDQNIDAFQKFPIDIQKKILWQLLDKNQLYVNMSSLNDKEFQCTESEKEVSRCFYGRSYGRS